MLKAFRLTPLDLAPWFYGSARYRVQLDMLRTTKKESLMNTPSHSMFYRTASLFSTVFTSSAKSNMKRIYIFTLLSTLLATGEVHSSDAAAEENIEGKVVDFIEFPLQEVTTFANSGIIPSKDQYGADGISVSENGDVFVSGGQLTNSVIRITNQGVVSEFATGFKSVNGSDFDSKGNLFVADYASNMIRRISPEGTVSSFASGLDGPAGVYVDEQDNVIVGLYGADYSGKGSTVLRITPSGDSSVLAAGGGLRDVIGVVGDENGELYAGNYKGRQLYRITDGTPKLVGTSSVKINMIDYSRGYVYIANKGRIVRINTSTGEEELFAGTPESKTVNGPVESADFVKPTSLAFSPDGNTLYVVDSITGDVRKIGRKEP